MNSERVGYASTHAINAGKVCFGGVPDDWTWLQPSCWKRDQLNMKSYWIEEKWKGLGSFRHKTAWRSGLKEVSSEDWPKDWTCLINSRSQTNFYLLQHFYHWSFQRSSILWEKKKMEHSSDYGSHRYLLLEYILNWSITRKMIDIIPYFAGLITLIFSAGFYFAIRQPNRGKWYLSINVHFNICLTHLYLFCSHLIQLQIME